MNCVAPGAIDIERTRLEDANYAETWGRVTPLGRVGVPKDVAEAVVFLASDAAAFVTGQTIWVDGDSSRSRPGRTGRDNGIRDQRSAIRKTLCTQSKGSDAETFVENPRAFLIPNHSPHRASVTQELERRASFRDPVSNELSWSVVSPRSRDVTARVKGSQMAQSDEKNPGADRIGAYPAVMTTSTRPASRRHSTELRD